MLDDALLVGHQDKCSSRVKARIEFRMVVARISGELHYAEKRV